MASALSKKLRGTRGYRKTKLFLKRVSGKELWLRPELSVASIDFGDWALGLEDLGPGSVVYSLGVGDDIGLDLALIEQFGVEVHAFDPTPGVAEWVESQDLSAGFHFHPWAAAGSDGALVLYPRKKRDGSKSDMMYTMMAGAGAADPQNGVEVPAFTIDTLMHKLGHNHVDLLKMDIEGAEYEVLEALIASSSRPRQLLVEFHHRFPSIAKSMTSDIIEGLRRIGYRIFAVSGTGREVSFIYRPTVVPAIGAENLCVADEKD